MSLDSLFIVAGFNNSAERDQFLARTADHLKDAGLEPQPAVGLADASLERLAFIGSMARYVDPMDPGDARHSYRSMVQAQAVALLGAARGRTVLYTHDSIDCSDVIEILMDAARGEVEVVDETWIARMGSTTDSVESPRRHTSRCCGSGGC
ncbi:hypothetical protein [Luteipulveratus halotolerans]|uniref:hypothetical protein n=1 Tax=Luteipulveratus halotolerans TaxID=1631356 RepID=UPI0012F7AFD5|nr:hypothetical protein [Luteipulveratus halotolerans]